MKADHDAEVQHALSHGVVLLPEQLTAMAEVLAHAKNLTAAVERFYESFPSTEETNP
jgi:hypothetical protein